ncbi:glycosyltransferase family 2 protein [Dehalobacterium formicoaceticum]|uniref:glycosyltransferase family 2 protein n=1 Tax=Dehalobacterium formicoaceticum TaxID=51515 RepID=UPI000B7D3353|nr:glycosyltransferase family 2 protein [Dehalobacterium formicoaceticum]
MSNKTFSIIVPIYKVESYIRQCIESLINQSYADIEIVLVDDGSPDNCPSICDKYASIDERVKVVHKRNGGIVSARQAGVAIATGEYLICVDGDDWVDIDYCKRMVDVIEMYNPDIVCCGYYLATEESNEEKHTRHRIGYYTLENLKNEIYPKLIQAPNATYFSPSLWAKAFRINIYKQQQLVDVNVTVGEDGACTIPSIYHARSMYIMPDCMYYYRYNISSITKGHNVFKWDGPEIIANHLAKQIDVHKFDFQEQLYRKITHEVFSVVVSQFYKKEPYSVIKKDILYHLDLPLYSEAVKKCHFKHSFKAQIMKVALKYRLILLIQIYAKYK